MPGPRGIFPAAALLAGLVAAASALADDEEKRRRSNYDALITKADDYFDRRSRRLSIVRRGCAAPAVLATGTGASFGNVRGRRHRYGLGTRDGQSRRHEDPYRHPGRSTG